MIDPLKKNRIIHLLEKTGLISVPEYYRFSFAESDGKPLLHINQLSVRLYKSARDVREVLSSVTMTIPPRSIICLLGGSGAGKSMLASALTGLLPENAAISHGDIIYKNICIPGSRLHELRGKEIVYLPQDASAALNPTLKIKNHLPDKNKNKSAAFAEILASLAFPFPDRILNSYPFQLSGGEKKRCVLALGLLLQPPLLILDEPTDNLDEDLRGETACLIKNFRDSGHSVLMISHDLAISRDISDVIYIMNNGQIIENGSPQEIFNSPRQPFTQDIIKIFKLISASV